MWPKYEFQNCNWQTCRKEISEHREEDNLTLDLEEVRLNTRNWIDPVQGD